MRSGAMEVTSRRTGCGSPWKVYARRVGWIIMSELVVDSRIRTMRLYAVSSGELPKTWRNCERLRGNMNCG